MAIESVFVDSNGIEWDIRTLLRSGRARSAGPVSVEDALRPLLDQRRWGEACGTVGEVLAAAGRREAARGTDGSRVDSVHINFVREVARKLRDGYVPRPVVFGPDGQLWDGLHRPAAARPAGSDRLPAVDFSRRPAEFRPRDVSALASRLSPRWLTRDALREVRSEFWGAAAYPLAVLDDFLTPESFAACEGQAEALPPAAWSPRQTGFYRHEGLASGVLGERDGGTPPGDLRRLPTGASFLRWLGRATGHGRLRRGEVTAHRMRRGDYVGLHNDVRAGGERLRGVLYLNGAGGGPGGAFVALGEGPAGRPAAARFVAPRPNRTVLFQISSHSNHLVTEVEDGRDRLSLNFSYFDEGD